MPNNSDYIIQRYILTMALAMGLNILPLSMLAKSMNPDWVLLLLIYWTLAIPERIRVFNAWLIGIFVDVLTGRILGMHGLVYAIICYSCLKFHRRIRNFPLPQQTVFIFFCLLIAQVLVFWIENVQGRTGLNAYFWLPVISGSLCWPVLAMVLRWLRLAGPVA